MNRKYEELTFRDDFMFCKVLRNNPDLCHDLLEMILGTKIGELVKVDKQYPVEITSDHRGVRFDVYARDDSSVIYDIEMQNAPRDHLPKRTRYIQGLVDLDQLNKGDHFSKLSRSYIIFICDFNIRVDIGRHKYTFLNLCAEDPSVVLNDETEKIFLCTQGTADDITTEMKQLLDYIAGKEPESEFAKKLDSVVKEARMNVQWRKEYMDLQDYVDDAREEVRKELQALIEEANARAEEANTRAEEANTRADKAVVRNELLEKEIARYKEKYGNLN